MKTILHKSLLLVTLLPALLFAGNGDGGRITKEKKISKSYTVNNNAALTISNQYGNVYVTTWDENKTAIDVVIKVTADKEETVDKRIASIDISFSATAAQVLASTSIGRFSGRNVNMEINYTIKIPKRGSAQINNEYGGTILGKIYGNAEINVQYGDLAIDELNSGKNSINMQYSGSSKINYINNATINAEYSELKITKADDIVLHSDYTNTKIGTVNKLNYTADYGGLMIDNSAIINGRSDYSSVRFGTISNAITANLSYGDLKIENMARTVKDVVIRGDYANIAIKYDANAAFDFTFDLEYGNLKGAQDLKILEKKKSDEDATSHYKGYYRTSGSGRMIIKSEYGDISLTKI
jgi:hypothetical protein